VSVAEAPAPAAALDVATAIGFGIARRAIRHDGRCTWFDGIPALPGVNPATSAASGPDVYGGTAGIGLFLAQLAARVDDRTLRRTARGALRHALLRAADAPALGFYAGRAGVAAAAVLAGADLGDDELIDGGLTLLRFVALRSADVRASDLLNGIAGSLLAFAVAYRVRPDDALLRRARSAAEALLGCAREREDGALSWDTMPDASGDLTGFAHGTAGIAYALLALHAIDQDAAWRDALARIFAYERSCYSAEHANWPDFRWFGGPRVAGYTNAWCHGAVGIVRTRLLAARLGVDAGTETDAALDAVARLAETLLAMPGADVTLCHGLFGAVDALLAASRAGRTAYAPLVARCAETVAARHHAAEAPLPSGLTSREQIDGLLMGSAGVGHVFLRLADPALASVLAPAG